MRVGALVMLSMVVWSCDGNLPDPSRIGVFADTGSLVELSSYAKQSSSFDYQVPDPAGVPEAKRVDGFYVNMPDVTITESKVVWFGEIGTQIDERRLEILETKIEKTDGGTFRISSPALQSKSNGVVGLKVIMPLGTADRIYLLRLR